jgi:predicted Zn-dependent protease
MRADWQGYFYDGETARRHNATVYVEPQGLTIRLDDGTSIRRLYSQMRQTEASVGGQPVRIEFPGAGSQILIIPDQEFVAAAREIAPGAPFRPERGDPRKPILVGLLAVGTLVIVAAAAAIYLWVLPALAGVAADRVPVELEEHLGKVVLESIAKKVSLCSSAGQTAALTEIVGVLAAAAPGQPYDFEVTVVDDPTLNAFAAPGGYIVVYRGLLEASESPEEIAGVLAHEMQHVIQRHVTRSLFRELALWVMLSTVTGDANTLLIQVGRVAGGLSYRRQDEEAADREGMRLLQRARIDPAGMVNIYQKLDEVEATLSGGLEYLSTHPAMDDRIAELEHMAAAADYESVRLPAGGEWAEMRRKCRPE